VPPRFISPPNDFGNSEGGNVTLTFGGSTDAIGFYLLTAGTVTSYIITVTTISGTHLIEPLVFQPNPSFPGFIAPEGITSVMFTHFTSTSRINFSFVLSNHLKTGQRLSLQNRPTIIDGAGQRFLLFHSE